MDQLEATPTCSHHWRIAPPPSPMAGICSLCGEQREFTIPDERDATVWRKTHIPRRRALAVTR